MSESTEGWIDHLLPTWAIPRTSDAMYRRLWQVAVALAVGGVLQLLLWVVR